MLSIASPDAAPLEGALDGPGGFAWWYADLLDDQGNGVVLIVAWSLPFLPGLMGAARSGQGTPARDRPAIALSVYEAGRPAYYLVQELPCTDLVQNGLEFEFGASRVGFWNGGMDARLDLDGPGGRLLGTVSVSGVARRPGGSPLVHDAHEWTPLVGPARGTWDLRFGGRRFRGAGSGYVDRNAGNRDLETLGLARWAWARTQLPDRLRIAYAVWPADSPVRGLLVDVLEDGTTEAFSAQVDTGPARRNVWGLTWWKWFSVRAGSRMLRATTRWRPDESFSYQRTLASAATELGDAPAVAEVCDVQRIDQAWTRPLVRMAVHRVQGPNSVWLPYFSGPGRSFADRFFGQFALRG